MDQVFIKDLIVQGILGIDDCERITPQPIIINAILYTDLHSAAKSDDISDCVDYRILSEELVKHTQQAERFTVEALANDLAMLCLHQPNVQKVFIRVEKPEALPYAKSVGVEIERNR